MRKQLPVLSAVLFFIAFAVSAHAITIVPARQNIEYLPGETIQLSFGVGNFGDGMSYAVDIKGDYAENAQLVKKGGNMILVDFTLPAQATPGQHELLIGAIQVPEGVVQSDMISARAAVYSQVRFFVPYPARYAEISLDNTDIELGKMAYFTVNFRNYGKETLNRITGNVSIIDPKNQTIAVVPLSNRSSLVSLQNTEMFAQWNTENQSAGVYRTVANVDYDGIPATAEGQLRVGTMDVKIKSIRAVGNVKSGVVKINVDISSVWNEHLDSVYAKGIITKNNTVLANLKSASLDLDAWGSGTLVLYWDVLNLDVGIYDITVDLFFSGLKKTTDTQIYLMEAEAEEQEEASNTMLYGAVLLLLLAVLFLSVIILKTKKGGSDEE